MTQPSPTAFPAREDNELAEHLEYLEHNAAQAVEALELAEAVKRLRNHPDFKKVVLEGYFKHEAQRLVLLRGDAVLQDPQQQAAILRDIDGIGVFHAYLSTVMASGRNAQAVLADIAQTREDLVNQAHEEIG